MFIGPGEKSEVYVSVKKSMLKPNAFHLLNTVEEKCLYVEKRTIMAPDLPGVRKENHDNSITIGLILLTGTYCIRKTNAP
jgi:hypothetical protein